MKSKGKQMKNKLITHLSRRERQIMDIIYQKGEATVAEVRKLLPDPPSYSAVRALLSVLEKKEYLKHKEHGRRFTYYPTVALDRAKRSALKHLMETFFDDSAERVMAALLNIRGTSLSEKELERMARLIEEAKKEGK
jgi:BlaI family penicillinase repressor